MKIKYAIDFFLLVFRRESGAMTLLFAIMFPMLLMFFSFALDGARFQSTRARLADAINQGALAIAINDRCDYVADKECAVRHGNKKANEKLLSHYLNYYFPNITFTDNDLDVIVNLNRNNAKELTSIDYNATGIAKLHPIFRKYNGVGFSDDVIVRADSSVGKVRKSLEKHNPPTDFVFIVDISGSMSNKLGESSDTKFDILKKAVVNFSQTILNNNEKNTIGIVPFNVGVPVKLSKTNLFGGKETGCSFAGKLKKEYVKFKNKSVDFNFWYNKYLGSITNVGRATTDIEKQSVNFDFWYNKHFAEKTSIGQITTTFKIQDKIITSFYEKIVADGLHLTMPQMVDKKWCTISEKNIPFYSCDADSRANLSAHPDEFDLHYDHVRKLHYIAYYDLNVVNTETIDFDETLKDENLFSDKSVTTYTHFPYYKDNIMFTFMCFDRFYRRDFSTLMEDFSPSELNKFVKTMKYRQSPPSYLIELTSNPDVISHFKKMQVMGGRTDTSSGLLRSLPVIAKGHNAKKTIIMVTDGDDTTGLPEYHNRPGGSSTKRNEGPKGLSRILHQNYEICNRIKKGLLTYNKIYKTNKVDIFYISLTSKNSDDTHIQFWRNSCVGDGNAFFVNDYKALMDVLTKISKPEKINFIDKSGF